MNLGGSNLLAIVSSKIVNDGSVRCLLHGRAVGRVERDHSQTGLVGQWCWWKGQQGSGGRRRTKIVSVIQFSVRRIRRRRSFGRRVGNNGRRRRGPTVTLALAFSLAFQYKPQGMADLISDLGFRQFDPSLTFRVEFEEPRVRFASHFFVDFLGNAHFSVLGVGVVISVSILFNYRAKGLAAGMVHAELGLSTENVRNNGVVDELGFVKMIHDLRLRHDDYIGW